MSRRAVGRMFSIFLMAFALGVFRLWAYCDLELAADFFELLSSGGWKGAA